MIFNPFSYPKISDTYLNQKLHAKVIILTQKREKKKEDKSSFLLTFVCKILLLFACNLLGEERFVYEYIINIIVILPSLSKSNKKKFFFTQEFFCMLRIVKSVSDMIFGQGCTVEFVAGAIHFFPIWISRWLLEAQLLYN